VKRNVLAGFTKVLLLPVTIIPKTAAFGFNVISIGATGAFNTVASLGAGLGAGFGNSASKTKAAQPSPSSHIDSPAWSIDDATVSSTPQTSSPTLTPSTSSVAIKTTTINRFDRMQMLLSLDTSLQLIQANRDCLKRVQTFARYPGVYGQKVRDGIEEVFIILLQTMGEKHVCPAFAKATAQMSSYKAIDHVGGTTVAPLVQFFELVHIGDTIQQMVQVYFDKELVSPACRQILPYVH
jgi:recyclin-1